MSLNANLLQKELKISLDPCNFSFNSKSTTRGRGWSSRINVSLLMMRECPCSTKTREVLGNPSPPPSRFPLAVGFALWKSLGSRAAKPTASGNLSRFPSTLEISLGLRPREISRVSGNLLGVGDGFPNTSLVLVEHGYNTSH